MEKLKFVLIDNNINFRKALRTLLIDQFDVEIIGEASSAKEALQINGLALADIILMDVMMPEVNGIELAKELLWHHNSKLRIIAITMHVEKVYLTTLIEAGFKGCIFKNDLTKHLGNALSCVLDGRVYFPEEIQFGHIKSDKEVIKLYYLKSSQNSHS